MNLWGDKMQHTTYWHIDDCLGASRGRFFAEGYRRVERMIREVRLDAATDWRIVARASLHYPPDWSCKATGQLVPHLSSIDALLIACDLIEAYLLAATTMSTDERRRAWICGFKMLAGSQPTERLEEFDVCARPIDTQEVVGALGTHRTVFECRVASIKLSVTTEHNGALKPQPREIAAERCSDLLGPDCARYLGSHYRHRKQEISEIRIGEDGESVEARVATPPIEVGEDYGLGGWYHPTLSCIEVIAALAQLAQVLLYTWDNLSRDRSNTLWMRSVWMSCRSPYHPVELPALARVGTRHRNVVELGGRQWRTAELHGKLLDFTVGAKLAHVLPDTVPAPKVLVGAS
ncbi:MAG: hypothetical protein IRZ02_05700 [Acidothermus sp.]|nr:hypothetical protein [Acidothermus sp.]